MQAHGLLQQQADSGASAHAVTTPRIQPVQEVLAKAEAKWSAKLHGALAGCLTSVAPAVTVCKPGGFRGS